MAGERRRPAGDAAKGDARDIDALFQLPLGEFTAARNDLASRLKKAGHTQASAKVKALVKPSISAWAVNQLYWRHQEAFANLTTAGQKFREVQAALLRGKAADVRGAQDPRREAVSSLSRLAEALLRETGHGPTPEIMRRIIATLDAISSFPADSDDSRPGRLTEDVNPPGFESVAALIPAGGAARRAAPSRKVVPFRPASKQSASKEATEADTTMASAKTALQAAERTLKEARTLAEDLLAARKKAAAEARETEEKRLEAEELYREAARAEQEARKRLHRVSAEAEKAAKAEEAAARAVEKARNELKSTR